MKPRNDNDITRKSEGDIVRYNSTSFTQKKRERDENERNEVSFASIFIFLSLRSAQCPRFFFAHLLANAAVSHAFGRWKTGQETSSRKLPYRLADENPQEEKEKKPTMTIQTNKTMKSSFLVVSLSSSSI